MDVARKASSELARFCSVGSGGRCSTGARWHWRQLQINDIELHQLHLIPSPGLINQTSRIKGNESTPSAKRASRPPPTSRPPQLQSINQPWPTASHP